MTVEVTRDAIEAMERAASAASPNEACGILLGKRHKITRAVETRNVHSAPETHFEIDPQALIDAHRAARAGGPEIVGYFHSHPSGEPTPSQTDQDMAAGDGAIWAICANETVGFYRSGKEGFEPLPIILIEG